MDIGPPVSVTLNAWRGEGNTYFTHLYGGGLDGPAVIAAVHVSMGSDSTYTALHHSTRRTNQCVTTGITAQAGV